MRESIGSSRTSKSQENKDREAGKRPNLNASGNQTRQPLDELHPRVKVTKSSATKDVTTRIHPPTSSPRRLRSNPTPESPERDLRSSRAPLLPSFSHFSSIAGATLRSSRAAASTPNRPAPAAPVSKSSTTTPVNRRTSTRIVKTPTSVVTTASSNANSPATQKDFGRDDRRITRIQASAASSPALQSQKTSSSSKVASSQGSSQKISKTPTSQGSDSRSLAQSRTPQTSNTSRVNATPTPASSSSRRSSNPAHALTCRSSATSASKSSRSSARTSSPSRASTARVATPTSSSNLSHRQTVPPCLLDEPTQVMSEEDVNAAFYPTLNREQKIEVKEAQEKKIVDHQFPHHTVTPRPRTFLQIDQFGTKDIATTGRYLPGSDKKCVFCAKATSEALIQCHGTMNLRVKKGPLPPCKSHFHWSCFTAYNAANFHGHYAALPECHGRLLCPLHCCAACTTDGKQQSAYMRGFTECALCLRSFHVDTCLPVGSKIVQVDCDIGDGNTVSIEMMVCPAHKECTKTPSNHLGICEFCHGTDGELKNCATCVRSFHEECCEVETIDGKPRVNQCEYCACRDSIRYDVPVIALFSKDRKFYLGFTREWHLFPSSARSDSRYDALGYVPVKWLDGTWSLVRHNELIQLGPVHLDYVSGAEQDEWAMILEASKKMKRFKPVIKEVCKTAVTSRIYRPGSYRPYSIENEDLCTCKGPKRCSDSSCPYVFNGVECPPICVQGGRVCHNRSVSDRVVSTKIRLEQTEMKGYGVFATAPIAKGEFLAEYVGEIIDRAEKTKRLRNIEVSQDKEANQYFMDTLDGMCIDASRTGNIARYINHSCEPNAGSHNTRVFLRNDEKNDAQLYEPRAYVRAEKAIEEGEEITFNYGWEDLQSLPRCFCGSSVCTGYMGGVPAAKRDSSDGDSNDDDEPSTSCAPPPKKAKKSTVRPIAKSHPQPLPAPSRKRSSIKAEVESDLDVKPSRKSLANSTASFPDRRRSSAIKIEPSDSDGEEEKRRRKENKKPVSAVVVKKEPIENNDNDASRQEPRPRRTSRNRVPKQRFQIEE